jgi:hypothetical protein
VTNEQPTAAAPASTNVVAESMACDVQ